MNKACFIAHITVKEWSAYEYAPSTEREEIIAVIAYSYMEAEELVLRYNPDRGSVQSIDSLTVVSRVVAGKNE